MLFGYSLCLHRNTDPGCSHESVERSVQKWLFQISTSYYGMSVDRRMKILRYVGIVGARSHPTVAYRPVT